MNISDIGHILKDQYLPAVVNQIQTEPSAFLEKIKKTPLTGAGSIKWASPIGLNGGFGFGVDGEGTPKAGAQNYADFEIKPVDMYVNIEISDKTVKLANTDKNSMIRTLDTEIKSSYETAKWNLGRALFGNGSGKLATVTANASASNVIKVSDTSSLIEGLTIDIYADGSATPAVSKRIVAVDRANGEITVGGEAITVSAGFITVQNSYNRELCGMGAIFDNNISTLYGKKKSENAWIKPVVVDAKNAVTDLVLYEGVMEAKRHKRSNIDMILCGDNAFKAFQEFMSTKKTQVVDTQKFVGGATGYNVLVGDQTVTIVNEQFVPTDKMWGVDTKQFELQTTGWDFAAHDSSVFTLVPGTSFYRALVASYGNLLCYNPGGCVEFINCGE